MTYEEKREVRLQISQMLADAGLNQKVIKDMVNTEIKNKVDRAIEQCIISLDSECSSGNYIRDRINSTVNSYMVSRLISDCVKDELKNRVIKIVLENCSIDEA